MGARIVVLKLGEQGLYLRTHRDLGTLPERIGGDAEKFISEWTNRELMAPCFHVEVAGTTGAGDCTIAGFLAEFLQWSSPELTLTTAVAVGAFSVEAADSTSGVRPLTEVTERMSTRWERNQISIQEPGWSWDEQQGVWKPE